LGAITAISFYSALRMQNRTGQLDSTPQTDSVDIENKKGHIINPLQTVTHGYLGGQGSLALLVRGQRVG